MLAINPRAICHQLFCFSHTEPALRAFALSLSLFLWKEKRFFSADKVKNTGRQKKEEEKT